MRTLVFSVVAVTRAFLHHGLRWGHSLLAWTWQSPARLSKNN